MDFKHIHNVYFLGIGGIGMSALARYFNAEGCKVTGYDLTPTDLTDELINEGIEIHFEENISLIPKNIIDTKNESLIIYTPAIPKDHQELLYFKENEFIIYKRSEILGFITQNKKGVAIAGTHGKTTISTMVAYLLNNSGIDSTAFLGGIAKNFDNNVVISRNSDYVVVEADEFDRSFLKLHPFVEVITAIDPDHLDIYGNKEELKKSFKKFSKQLKKGGKLIVKKGLDLTIDPEIDTLTYSLNEKADFYVTKLLQKDGLYTVDVRTPKGIIKNITIGIPGLVNVENALAAIAVAYIFDVDEEKIKSSMSRFSGVKRRFDIQINNSHLVFIDDYAHHPKELEAFINSVRDIYKGKKITGIFQPHLYSRTNDFADGFAESLNLLDELILLNIYPAREKPMEGVSSELILNKVNLEDKILCEKGNLLNVIKKRKIEILLTMGAGDIDKLVEPLRLELLKKIKVSSN